LVWTSKRCSKTNIEKGNNFWGDCDDNTANGATKSLLERSFINNLNSAFCVPVVPKVWEYDEFKIETIIKRTEIIVDKLTRDLNEFTPSFD